MNTKQRLKTFIKSQGLTIRNFEESIGVSNGYVNSISKGIGKDKLQKIIEKYSNIDIVWLLTGKVNEKRETMSATDSLNNDKIPDEHVQIITNSLLLHEDAFKKISVISKLIKTERLEAQNEIMKQILDKRKNI